MAKKPVKPVTPPAAPTTENRYFWSGVVFALFTMVVLAGILWMSINGKSISPQDQLFAVGFLAMGAGLSLGAFGGQAAAKGNVKWPGLDSPIKFAATGGAVVFAAVFFGARYALPAPSEPPPPAVSLNEAKGVVLEKAPKPDSVMVTAAFTAFQPMAERRAVLNLGRGERCDQVKSRETIDHPELGSFKSFVPAASADLTCAQITIHDKQDDRVGASKVIPITWQ